MTDSKAAGLIAGLSVSAWFFERRCELLEKVFCRRERLTDAERDEFKGCCPAEHMVFVVCKLCGLATGEQQ